ncbi:hypothetical protein [Mucilaginibacter pocheonensis]|uniref:Uncharacterized protein n=1 Tax=Mucilaginibacter pocheonensis TaxID=398050 RepID=A0ABU1T838_9SPHI|nr:hypothetical protein [Mucilaginibacter pocheonensis]MDR6941396.1 hypothetical protein [Mucilaginibacter pocheonensis]
MSILSDKTEHRAIQIIARSLKILEKLPPDVRMSKSDDFELSLAKNMLKSIIENDPLSIDISSPNARR